MKKLTDKQRKFLEEYLSLFEIRAGNSIPKRKSTTKLPIDDHGNVVLLLYSRLAKEVITHGEYSKNDARIITNYIIPTVLENRK